MIDLCPLLALADIQKIAVNVRFADIIECPLMTQSGQLRVAHSVSISFEDFTLA